MGLLNFWIFSDVQNAVTFFYNFYNPLFLKKVNYFLKMSRDFFKETFFLMYHRSDVIMYLFSDTSYDGKHVLANIEI